MMRIDGLPVAMELAVEEHGCLSLLKIGYDEAYRECSPGRLLLLHTLRYAMERRLSSLEMLGAAEPWTETWTKEVHPCVSIRVYPVGVRAQAVFAADLVSHGWSRLSAYLDRRAAARAQDQEAPASS
jgi:CelD/BcsL family acetyltransferase involved in cellulose biosynthesis